MVKKGYKQTEIGVIPEDWEVKELDTISNVIDPHPSHRAPTIDKNGIPFLGIGDLSENGEIIKSSFRKVNSKILDEHKQRYNLDNNLIGLGRVASIGKVIRLKKNIGKFVLSPTLGIIDTKIINTNFLFYTLKSFYVKQQFINIMSGSTRSSVGMIVLRKLKIPIPPKQEQEKIAKVLSDTDELIENLKELIAKKEDIKKATMQQLLTGKKRLKGFSGEWVERKLGEVSKIYNGLSGKKKEDFGDGNAFYIPFLNVINNIKIDINNLEKVYIYENESQNKVLKGDLVFNTSSETPYEVGMCALMDNEIEKVYLNSFCFGCRITDKSIYPLFLSYLTNSDIGRKIFSLLAQGATRYNLSKENFNNIKLFFPKDITEQKAIAKILSDMDEEIEALKEKLEKTEAIKQGMMQELLSGKIRLDRKDNNDT